MEGVEVVDGKVGHIGEVGDEACRNEGVMQFCPAISSKWSGSSGRWLEEEETGTTMIHEAEESNGWPRSEAARGRVVRVPGSRRWREHQEVEHRQVPTQRHRAMHCALRHQQPTVLKLVVGLRSIIFFSKISKNPC